MKSVNETGRKRSLNSFQKFKLGRIGLIFLGISFLLWAILIVIVEVAKASYLITNSSLNFLGLTSLGLTIIGLIFVNIGAGRIIKKGKALTRYATFFFVWINITGFYLAFTNYTGGFTFIGMSFSDYIILTSAFFTFYILLFSLFIAPFLNRFGRALILVAAVLMEAFMYFSMVNLQTFMLQPHPGMLPGNNMPYSVQISNPTFGFPLFQLNP